MALKKSELYSSLCSSCDDLRDGMDASQYEDYVLVLLFIKYISDKYAGQPYAPMVVAFNRQSGLPRYSRMVGIDEIEKNDFNLNLPRQRAKMGFAP